MSCDFGRRNGFGSPLVVKRYLLIDRCKSAPHSFLAAMSLPSFAAALAARRKCQNPHLQWYETDFHCQLRTMVMQFEKDMDCLLPQFEKIFDRLVHLQHTTYSGVAWKDHWKIVSMDGFDMHKGRCVDYGNVEYYVLLRCICHLSSFCHKCMIWLADQYFPSLHPEAELTNHTLEMHGDIFEI